MQYNQTDIVVKPESLILPNPEDIDSKYEVDASDVELPDDSLADTDLRDHDFIDNLMYIYYGTRNQNDNEYGYNIIMVGTLISILGHLTTILVMMKKKYCAKKNADVTFLYIVFSFFASNVVFLIGIFVSTCFRWFLNCKRHLNNNFLFTVSE